MKVFLKLAAKLIEKNNNCCAISSQRVLMPSILSSLGAQRVFSCRIIQCVSKNIPDIFSRNSRKH